MISLGQISVAKTTMFTGQREYVDVDAPSPPRLHRLVWHTYISAYRSLRGAGVRVTENDSVAVVVWCSYSSTDAGAACATQES
jgi:hypothetical protein